MTPARQIDPNTTFYVTVRCVTRSFRFVPKRVIREAIKFCLTVTQEKYRLRGDIQLYEFEFMGDHSDYLALLPP